MNINMNWEQDEFTVYALNDDGVNDFSFTVQGNGRNGHDPKKLAVVTNLAKHAPEMYEKLKEVMETIPTVLQREGLYDDLGSLLVRSSDTVIDQTKTMKESFRAAFLRDKEKTYE